MVVFTSSPNDWHWGSTTKYVNQLLLLSLSTNVKRSSNSQERPYNNGVTIVLWSDQASQRDDGGRMNKYSELEQT